MESSPEKYLPVVAGVALIGDHVLRLLFNDGTDGFDLAPEPLHEQAAHAHPLVAA